MDYVTLTTNFGQSVKNATVAYFSYIMYMTYTLKTSQLSGMKIMIRISKKNTCCFCETYPQLKAFCFLYKKKAKGCVLFTIS